MENKAYTMKVACLDRLTMKGTCKLSERWSLLDLTNIWLRQAVDMSVFLYSPAAVSLNL